MKYAKELNKSATLRYLGQRPVESARYSVFMGIKASEGMECRKG